MSSKNVLKPIDVNVSGESMDKSPARKKARYESPSKDGWSLSQNSVLLDEVFDFGVGVLESDSELPNDEDYAKVTTPSSTYEDPAEGSCPSSNANSEEPENCNSNTTNVRTISLTEWDSFIIKREDVNSTYGNDYFSLLSDEVVLHILHFLPKRQLTQIACVCKRFNCLTKDESLWARMDVSERVLYPGALGQILSRQVIILRLAQSEILSPGILPDCRASNDDFQSRLLYLDLSMVHASTETLVDLFSKCQRLKKISLEHVPVNDDVLKAIANNKDLEVINLAMAEGLDLDGMKALLCNCERLRELNLSWTYLNQNSIMYICGNLPKSVDRLNLSGCRKLLTDNHVMHLVDSCSKLRELDLSDCTGLTGNSINHIIRLKHLNFLALSRCYLISYRSLLLLKKMNNLIYLDIHGGYIDYTEIKLIQESLGSHVYINKFKFSSVARPTVGAKRSSIWNMRVRD